jgi:DNA polymerase III alpha subunit
VKLIKIAAIEEIDTKEKPSTITIAGILSQLEVRYSKKDNRPFATFKVEDFTGVQEMMCWSDDYEKLKDVLADGAVMAFRVRVSKDQKTDGNRCTCNDAKPLKPKAAKPRNAGDPDPSLPPPPKPPAPPKPIVMRSTPASTTKPTSNASMRCSLSIPGTSRLPRNLPKRPQSPPWSSTRTSASLPAPICAVR